MLTFKLLMHAVAFMLAAASEPLWKTLLRDHKQWDGIYSHDGKYYKCSLTVHSVEYVGFTSEHVSVDMRVSSDDNVTVTFKEASVWNSSAHFAGHTNLEFLGYFLKAGQFFHYLGNVSSDESKNFGTVDLSTSVGLGRSNESTRLRYGLAIGIPVTLCVLVMIAAVLILRWGVKKGYLRHVPWAYKHFTNPRRGRADFEMSDSEGHCESEQPEVHI